MIRIRNWLGQLPGQVRLHYRPLIFFYCLAIFVFDTFVRPISVIGAVALALTLLPWAVAVVKSIKLPGGFELELNRIQEEIQKEAENLPPGARAQEEEKFLPEYANDPNLALAGLRIEIEKRLRAIARQGNVDVGQKGLEGLLRSLQQKELIGSNIAAIIRDMAPTLNRAVHAEDVPAEAGDWVLRNGPSLLAALDQKL